MRFALKFLIASLAVLALPVVGAHADGSGRGPSVAVPIMLGGTASPGSWAAPRPTALRATPELAAPGSGGNYASTLQIGSRNSVVQAQLGAGNVSNVGIIGGLANNVGVLQAGNRLSSNLALINTHGLSVGVIQPNGSAPVNVLIARLPNGALLIKR